MVAFKRGFTLIELVIVIGMIGIIVAIAYPSYIRTIIKGQRSDMQAALHEVSQSLERYRVQMYSYNPVTPVTDATFLQQTYIFGSTTYPITTSDRRFSKDVQYDLSIQVVNNGAGYILAATPRAGSRQDGDGVLVVDEQGRTCWSKKDTTCSATSNTGTGW
jgi:type IV pilus assembly protein PilE